MQLATLRNRFRELSSSQEYSNRVINSMPEPMYPLVRTKCLGQAFSEHTLRVVAKYSKLSTQELASANNRIPRVAFVGGMGVGKTSILTRFRQNSFSDVFRSTLSACYELEQFQILDCCYSMDFLDTAGHDTSFSFNPCLLYRTIDVLVAVFDMSRPETLKMALNYVDNIAELRKSDVPLPTFLVGAQVDRTSSSTQYNRISQMGVHHASAIGAEYVEVSARTSIGITQLIQRIACVSFEQHAKGIIVLETEYTSQIDPSSFCNKLIGKS